MRKTYVFLSILGALLAIFAAASESGRWRRAVLNLKLTGELPHLSWVEVISGLRLCAWGPCHRPLVMGDVVTIVSTDTDNPCPVLWNTPYGPMRGFPEDRRIVEYSQTLSWFARSEGPKVEPGDVVLEIGAWLGNFTRRALDQGASLVVAFEPVPVNRSCFEQNLAGEIQDGRVIVIPEAAWDRAGQVRMANIGPDNEEGSRKGFGVADDGPVEAASVTIDEIVERLGLERVDLINMDIEGGEQYALRGAQRTLQRFRPVIVSCIHHLPGDRERIPKVVLDIEPGYDVHKTELHAIFRPISEAQEPGD